MPGAAFRLIDSVEIIAGEHAGQGGSAISIERLPPEPAYLVELADTDEDVHLAESELSAP